MKQGIITLFLGFAIGISFSLYSDSILSFINTYWVGILLSSCILALIIWIFYMNFQKIIRKTINTALPEYEDIVETGLSLIENTIQKRDTESLMQDAKKLSRQIAIKYTEILTRRLLFTVIISIFTVTGGFLTIALLKNQNEIMLIEKSDSDRRYLLAEMEKNENILKSYRTSREANLNHVFYNYFEAQGKLEDLGHTQYANLERMKLMDNDLYDRNLISLYLNYGSFENVLFEKINFSYSDLDYSLFRNCDFNSKCVFDSTQILNVEFQYCDFGDSDFTDILIGDSKRDTINTSFRNSVFIKVSNIPEDVKSFIVRRGGILTEEQLKQRLNELNLRFSKPYEEDYSDSSADTYLDYERLKEISKLYLE